MSKYRALMPFILAQAKHETGNFTSNLYLKNNNLFGMKLPTRRPTVATKGLMSPEGNYYAAYSSDGESIRDLFLWMDYTKFPTMVKNANEYASELKQRAYFGDSLANYQNALNKFLA